jgi:hypothetical protein
LGGSCQVLGLATRLAVWPVKLTEDLKMYECEIKQSLLRRQLFKQYREQKLKIMDDIELTITDSTYAQAKLALSFLNDHQDFSLLYNCSGRGLPASNYYNNIKALKHIMEPSLIEPLINKRYMARIEENNDYYNKQMAEFG